jgi:hypothetical protein
MFLSDIFPEVTGIYTFDGENVDDIEYSKWSQVGQLISTFVSIRLQERNYAVVTSLIGQLAMNLMIENGSYFALVDKQVASSRRVR